MEELKARNIRAMWNAVNELEDAAMHPGKKKSLSTETLFIAIAAIREIAEQTRHKNTANRRAAPENKALTAENEELKGRFAGSEEKSEYIKVPNNLSRELLIKEFGISAVEWYESYLADRISLGKTYLNPQKTIYLWATRDRKTGQGWFSRLPRQYDGHKSKGHGGS